MKNEHPFFTVPKHNLESRLRLALELAGLNVCSYLKVSGLQRIGTSRSPSSS
jgi:hypothetical protein